MKINLKTGRQKVVIKTNILLYSISIIATTSCFSTGKSLKNSYTEDLAVAKHALKGNSVLECKNLKPNIKTNGYFKTAVLIEENNGYSIVYEAVTPRNTQTSLQPLTLSMKNTGTHQFIGDSSKRISNFQIKSKNNKSFASYLSSEESLENKTGIIEFIASDSTRYNLPKNNNISIENIWLFPMKESAEGALVIAQYENLNITDFNATKDIFYTLYETNGLSKKFKEISKFSNKNENIISINFIEGYGKELPLAIIMEKIANTNKTTVSIVQPFGNKRTRNVIYTTDGIITNFTAENSTDNSSIAIAFKEQRGEEIETHVGTAIINKSTVIKGDIPKIYFHTAQDTPITLKILEKTTNNYSLAMWHSINDNYILSTRDLIPQTQNNRIYFHEEKFGQLLNILSYNGKDIFVITQKQNQAGTIKQTSALQICKATL